MLRSPPILLLTTKPIAQGISYYVSGPIPARAPISLHRLNVYAASMTKSWLQKVQNGFRQFFSDTARSSSENSPQNSNSKPGRSSHQFLARLTTSPESFFISAVDLCEEGFQFSTPRPISDGEALQVDVILPRTGLARLRAEVIGVKRNKGIYHGQAKLNLQSQHIGPWRTFIS